MINKVKKTKNKIICGDGFSEFGTWTDFIAILTMSAYQYKVTPWQMAVVSSAMLLPGILLSTKIGKICDKYNPKTILIFSVVCRILCTVGVIFSFNYYFFLFFILIRSIFSTTSPMAINVLVIRSLDESEITNFYSMLHVVNRTVKVIAPSLGAVLASFFGEISTLILSISFSVISVFVFLSIIYSNNYLNKDKNKEKESIPIEWKDKIVSMGPLLWVTGVYAFFSFMVNNLVPLAFEKAALDKSLVGILITCSGIGGIIYGLLIARKREKRATLNTCAFYGILQAIGFLLISASIYYYQSSAFYVLPLIFLYMGGMSGGFAIHLNILLAKEYKKNIGETSGTIQSVQNIMILLAPMVGAWILDETSSSELFFSAFVVGVLGYIIYPGKIIVGKIKSLLKQEV